MSRVRRWLSAAVVGMLVLVGLVAMPFSGQQLAQAGMATGTGNHVGSIYWLDWSTAINTNGSGTNNGRPYFRAQEGTSMVATPVGGVTVTATFEQVSATVRGSTSTSDRQLHLTQQDPQWSELKRNGYDTGSQYSVITPNTNATDANFRLKFTATLDNGDPAPVNIIAADGESAGHWNSESNIFTTDGDAWQNIDNTTRTGATMWTSSKTNGGFGTQTMGPWKTEISGGNGGMAPIGVSRGASTLDVEISASGMQNVMIGFMLPTDFGDAPESYGQASHFIDWSATGTPMGSPGTANAPAIAYNWEGIPYLGDVPADPDSGDLTGWTGDDDSTPEGAQPDEGWQQLIGEATPPVLYRGQTDDYSVDIAAGNAEGQTVAAWIDWNNNGAFDADERTTATVADGRAPLRWSGISVPRDVDGLGSRFRIASDPSQIVEPTGLATDGEVEDYLLPITREPLATVVKSSDPVSGTEVHPGDTIDYTLTFTGDPTAPAIVDHTDHLADVLDDALLDVASITTTGGLTAAFAESTQTLDISGVLPAGAGPETVSYSVTVKDLSDAGNQRVGNVVVPGGSTPPEGCDPESPHCTEHPVVNYAPNLLLDKSSDPDTGTAVMPGDSITYAVTTTNQPATPGPETAPVGPAAGVVLSDDLTDVLDDATFVPGSAQLGITGADGAFLSSEAVADPVDGLLTTAAFELPANSTAALTYEVTVNDDAWSATIGNVVTGTWDDPGTPDVPRDPIECTDSTSCATHHPTNAKLLIEKIGEASEGWIRMDGSAWEIRHDDGGAPGAVLETPAVVPVPGTDPASPETGLFQVEGIPAGDYWLTETRAPEGFNLLAEPVAFTVADDGSVTLGAGAGDGVVTVADEDAEGNTDGIHTVTVRDVPAMRLPETGGAGTAGFLAAGGGLLALGAALALHHRRRDLAQDTTG
ncbi:CshA/CshB family fibrillar adhesin-related protein [Citricoccus sp. NPDC055426]|uniref:CshA/CshB family fibrillar adhesin-related protein n=1 Tax=Citricoccus sp. NPDC055426 TaxID=3155536 RepID=UPI0034453860